MLTFQQRCIATVGNFPFLQHLANDHFDVLVVDFHTLQTVHILDLVDHIVGQGFDTHDGQNIMRRRVAVHQVFTFLDKVTLHHWDVFAFGNHVFHWITGFIDRLDADTTFVFVVLAKAYITIDFRDDRVIFGATCFEQFGNTWQTTGDVFRFCTFAWNTCKHVTGTNVCTIFDRQNRIN